MKTAVYSVDKTTQVVLTPETDFEKHLLKQFKDQPSTVIKWGVFYECIGGWYRQGAATDEESMMLRVDAK